MLLPIYVGIIITQYIQYKDPYLTCQVRPGFFRGSGGVEQSGSA